MTDDPKLKEARAGLLLIAQILLAILKDGDREVILLAADTLDEVVNSPTNRGILELFEARRTAGLN